MKTSSNALFVFVIGILCVTPQALDAAQQAEEFVDLGYVSRFNEPYAYEFTRLQDYLVGGDYKEAQSVAQEILEQAARAQAYEHILTLHEAVDAKAIISFARILHDPSCDVNQKGDPVKKHDDFPLWFVVEKNFIKAFLLLLADSRTDVNLRRSEKTLLHHAAFMNYEHAAKLLCAHPKVDLLAVTSHESTALHIAVLMGYVEIVSVLLKTMHDSKKGDILAIASIELGAAEFAGHTNVAGILSEYIEQNKPHVVPLRRVSGSGSSCLLQ